jgi:hypothetical protein
MQRVVLHFHPKIAPVQVAVFPLARNKSDLVERPQAIEKSLRPKFRTQYDEGNIGQLYRRQNEIGTVLHHGRLSITRRPRGHGTRSRLDAADRVAQDQLTAYLTERLEGG